MRRASHDYSSPTAPGELPEPDIRDHAGPYPAPEDVVEAPMSELAVLIQRGDAEGIFDQGMVDYYVRDSRHINEEDA